MLTVGFHVGIGARPLDLNSLLIKRPASTFFWIVEGDLGRRFGLENGDLLIVDRAERRRPDSLVLVTQNGTHVIRRPTLGRCEMTEEILMWGVIINIIRPLDDVIRRQLEPREGEG